MNRKLRIDAEKAAYTAINAVMPEGAVRRALQNTNTSFPNQKTLTSHPSNPTHSDETPQ